MAKQIFVNLPVKNLKKSMAFFTQLGYRFNPEYTDENAACMIVGDNIFVMLLTEKFFKTFINKDLCDARRSTEVLMGLPCETRAMVDDLVAKALAAGGKAPMPPKEHGFMYEHYFEDLDGHVWDLFYMEPSSRGSA